MASTAGFELALEWTVTATFAVHKVAEVVTTLRDRAPGQRNSRLRDGLPLDLRWCVAAFRATLPPRSRDLRDVCEASHNPGASR